jgi:hypothetical protein
MLKIIRQTNYQSCVIQLSEEKPIDIETLEGNNSIFRTLRLGGLDKAGREIFRAKGLKDESSWEREIASYYGNPKYLEIVATSIKKSFGGKVSCISRLEQIFIPAQLKSILANQFERLSQLEQRAIAVFAS